MNRSYSPFATTPSSPRHLSVQPLLCFHPRFSGLAHPRTCHPACPEPERRERSEGSAFSSSDLFHPLDHLRPERSRKVGCQLLLPLFSYSYALFCIFKNAISILLNTFRTLFAKHPGWGTPYLIKEHLPPLHRSRNCHETSIHIFRRSLHTLFPSHGNRSPVPSASGRFALLPLCSSPRSAKPKRSR